MKNRKLVHGALAVVGAMMLIAPTRAVASIVNLSNIDGDITLADGDIATGTLGGNYKVSIADGAMVTLNGVKIRGGVIASCDWAGINCKGDATIVLEEASDISSFSWSKGYPGIHVPKGKTLTIRGRGRLAARSSGRGAGIGGGLEIDCGNIVIEGGTISATGGDCAAGIGGGQSASCGDISIVGGKVTSDGGYRAAGIGSGWKGSCGKIDIRSGIIGVTGVRGEECLNPIGNGKDGTSGKLTVDESLFFIVRGSTYTIKPGTIVDLSKIKGDTVLRDLDIVTGEVPDFYKVSIADGATVRLSGANVSKSTNWMYKHKWAGLTCLGDATIILEHYNTAIGFGYGHPGIYVPKGKTLTIDGDGHLFAKAYYCGAGIGGGEGLDSGNIVINGGEIVAEGMRDGAGIGGGGFEYGTFPWFNWTSCGNIVINGGTITAKGGKWGSGIGGGVVCRCGNITINGGSIDATGSTVDMLEVFVKHGDYEYPKDDLGIGSPGIGAGGFSSCGDIRINGGDVTARGGRWAAGIGTGNACLSAIARINRSDARCGKIFISGGSVTATGGERAAGIGTGCDGTCGDIEIDYGVSALYAIAGDDGAVAVGAGKGGTCGSIEVLKGNFAEAASGRIAFAGMLNLSDMRNYDDIVVPDGTTLSGTLNYIARLFVEEGAHVTFKDATIQCINSCDWPGLTCLGDATITLVGNNSVTASYELQPGIFVPWNSTLTIKGNGSLYAAAAVDHAYGGSQAYGAGIGATFTNSCGNIVLDGGSITAVGGVQAAGIGGAGKVKCGSIAINSGVSFVSATAGSSGAEPIGAGYKGTSDGVTVASNLRSMTDGLTTVIGPLVCSLSEVTEDTTLQNGMVAKGTLGGNYKVSIAAGATVTLKDATIEGVDNSNYKWAGITCEGDATIVLEGKNTVIGFYDEYPGIYVPPGSTLTIKGSGSLTAFSRGYATGIGGGSDLDGGNIVIESGTITAVSDGDNQRGGIGGGNGASFGDITILGGTVIASRFNGHAAIGSSFQCSCGDITILGGTVIAEAGYSAAGIGSGNYGSCGDITIGPDVTRIVAEGCYAIGAARHESTCGEISVDPSLSDATIQTIQEDEDYYMRTISTCDLSRITADTVFGDGAVLTGTLDARGDYNQRCRLSIADGATVTLKNARIKGVGGASYPWPGLSCEGDATIVLEGVSHVRGFHYDYPGIWIPEGYTLTITGDGTLEAYCGTGMTDGPGNAPGIGAGGYVKLDNGEWGGLNAGNIVIEGGYIVAEGGDNSAAIGTSYHSTCGDITITGGSGVVAKGEGYFSRSIGAGAISSGDVSSRCGTVTVYGEVYGNGGVFESPFTYPLGASDLTCNITFDPMGGTVAYGSKTVKKGTSAGTLPTPTKSGYKFVGWFTDPENGELKNATSFIFEDIALYAHWTASGSSAPVVDDGTITLSFAPSYDANKDGSWTFDVGACVKSESTPTISVKGLPAGIKYDSKTKAISGTCTKPGSYTVTVSVTNQTQKKAITAQFTLVIPNKTAATFESAGLLGSYTLSAGVAPDISSVVAALEADGWKVTVSGLPSGVSYKNGNLTGIATKEGIYTVTFTAAKGNEKQTATSTFGVTFPVLELSVIAWNDPAASGTVTGGGRYPAQTKVTLKATPAKNCVFAGWCNADGEPLLGSVDYRTASFTHMTGVEDEKIFAMFATAQEDADSLSIHLVDATTAPDGTYSLDLGALVSSITIPSLAVKGLPSGLKYDAKTMTISGKATKSGKYKVAVTATNTSVKKGAEQTFTLTVPNNGGGSGSAMPGLETDPGAYGVNSVGVEFDPWLVDCMPADGWSVKVSGLPAGLKFDAKECEITGVPTKAGVYTVTFTATKGNEKQVTTITLEIEALKDWVVASFVGAMFDGAEDVVGQVQNITVSANGKISGKIIDGDKTWTVSAPSFEYYSGGIYTALVTYKAGKEEVQEEVDFKDGVVEALDWTAWRNVWKDADRKDEAKTLKNLKIGPARGDTVTFSAPSAAGAVTAKLKDGAYSASCSSTLIPGEGGYTLFWYFPPKSGKFAGDGGREFVK